MSVTEADYLRAVHAEAWGLAYFYGRALDAGQDATDARLSAPGALGQAARFYARRGLPVLPLTPGAKVPLGGGCCGGSHRRGSRDACTDPATVAGWWVAHPAANVGLATGHRFDVLDQDGPDGALSWCRGCDWPPVAGIVSTPRPGGVHRYVTAAGLRNGQRIAPGIDYRGRGGYVVAPPSVVNGRRYRWVAPLEALQ